MIKNFTIKMPSIVGNSDYSPSALQLKILCGYMEGIEKGISASPMMLLKKAGHSKANWYHWLSKTGFMAWWTRSLDEFHLHTGIPEVHKAIFKRARRDSSADAKLYLERFDKDYKPTVRAEIDIFAGRRPEDAEDAVGRSKQRLDAVNAEKE